MERYKPKIEEMIDASTVKEMEDVVFSNLKALKYLHSLGLNDEAIKNNIAKIYDFAVDMENCKGCKGLAYCNKEPKHLVNSVSYKGGVVDRNLVPCKKYLEFANFKKRLAVYDFEEEWLNNTFTTVSNARSKSKTAILNEYVKVCKKESNRWIFIKGNVASGKSYFAATMIVESARKGDFQSLGFMNVPSRFKELSDLAFTKNPRFDDEMDKYKTIELLVLDDFGNEFKSDFVRDNILFPIISARLKNKLPTIITSNYTIDDCASMYQTTNASKPKIEQIRQMLNLMCEKEFILIDPSLL